jgi:DNA-binding protein HU-beta
MNKKDLISKTVDVLRENNIRKPVQAQKMVLHISDDYGNQSDFTVKKSDRGLLFTSCDVGAVIDACLAVIEDSIKHGEDVSIHGFGTIGLHYRAARQTKHPETGDLVNIKARYVPKFNFGNTLRTAARVYELSLEETRDGE